MTCDGTLAITLAQALERTFRGVTDRHDLTVEVHRREGRWQPEATATARTYNNRLHQVDCQWRQPSSGTMTLDIRANLEPDPWVPGGPLRATIELAEESAGVFLGRHAGTFRGQAIAGEARAKFRPQPVSGGMVAAGSPAILAEFAARGAASRLYDFSRAGRISSSAEQDLPVFRVEAFGAVPDSGRESRDAVQAAVDAAAAAGGGIVLFPPGIFDLSVERKQPPVFIDASRIIVRGAGSGPDGTVLVNHRPSDTPDPKKPWLAGLSPGFFLAGPGVRAAFPDEPPDAAVQACEIRTACRGSCRLTVDDATGLRVGTAYLLRYREDAMGSLARALVLDACEPAANYRGEDTVLVAQLAMVEAIDGDIVTLDAPVHWDSRPEWHPELAIVEMLADLAIEGLRLRSCWDGVFVHHRNGEHDNGWDHIKMRRVHGGRIRDLVHESTTSAVTMDDCLGCLIEDQRIAGNPGHNGILCTGVSANNLFRRCQAGRQMHALGLSGLASGNAFVDCEIDEPGGLDLHGGIGLDNLFDRLLGGVNHGGGSPRAVPPRHGPGLVLWNWQAGRHTPYLPWQRHEAIADLRECPGLVAVGVRSRYGSPLHYITPEGTFETDRMDALAWIESFGIGVLPESLHQHQRESRRAGPCIAKS